MDASLQENMTRNVDERNNEHEILDVTFISDNRWIAMFRVFPCGQMRVFHGRQNIK